MTRLHKRYSGIAIAALVCLAVSVYFELVLDGRLDGPIATPESALEAMKSFTRELGFALTIALMISIGIEAYSRAEDLKLADRMRSAIALDVFKGVFSDRLPRTYIDRVVELHLQPSVIREGLNVHLTLEPVPASILAKFEIPEGLFALLTGRYAYRVRNISTGLLRREIKVMIPSRAGPWSDIAMLRNMRIGDADLTNELIESASSDGSSKTYGWFVDLGPNQEIDIQHESVLLKEVSDTELWSSFLPTLDAGFAFENHFEHTISGMRSMGSTPLSVNPEGDEVTKTWRLDGPILRNESVVIWWRPNDDPVPVLDSERSH